MRILHVGKYQFEKRGGIETLTYQLCRKLIDHAYDVRVLCSSEGNKTAVETYDNIPCVRAATWIVVGSAPICPFQFIYFLKNRKKFDLLHVHLPNPFVTFFLLLAGTGAKIVVHWHADVIKQKYLFKLYRPFLKMFLKRVDRIIATSPNYFEASSALREYRDKVSVITMGLDEPQKASAELVDKWKDRFGRKKIILSIGRLIYYKSYDVLIRAASHLSDDYHVVIVGKGEDKHSLENLVEKQAKGRVSLLSDINDNDKNALLEACDIFVLPSSYRSEAFGLVQVEAMQFAKPLVCCDIQGSGVSYVNKDGVSGLVTPVGDDKKMAEAIAAICGNEDIYRKFSEGSYSRYMELFRADAMVEKIEDLYKEIMEK
ncbi:MAG: glycosyltransferase [Deferribacterales bacterium]